MLLDNAQPLNYICCNSPQKDDFESALRRVFLNCKCINFLAIIFKELIGAEIRSCSASPTLGRMLACPGERCCRRQLFSLQPVLKFSVSIQSSSQQPVPQGEQNI